MSDAYVETTVLTNLLLKVGDKKQAAARAALARYDSTILPVYSIKEWKAGPLETFAWVHDKFALTKSLAQTVAAINAISPYQPYMKSTSQEALTAAARLERETALSASSDPDPDRELADRYRLALASLILRSWNARRSVTDQTIQDLDCYTETKPRIDGNGMFEMEPTNCEVEQECCLKAALIASPTELKALRDAIPADSERTEDVERRKVLKQLLHNPKAPLTHESCRRLGDAVFAFFCPSTAVVLTTNIKDHKPLANAVGKDAEKP